MGEEPNVETTEQKPADDAAPPAETTEERVYKQADVDNITAKVRTKLENKLKQVEAEAEKLRQAALSEDEKKLEQARKEGAETVRKELEAFKRQASIERELLAKGVNPELIDKASRLVDSDTEDVSAAVEALRGELPALFSTKQPGFGGGGGRNTDDTYGDEFPPERVEKIIAAGEYEKYAARIAAWRARKMGANAGWFPPLGQ